MLFVHLFVEFLFSGKLNVLCIKKPLKGTVRLDIRNNILGGGAVGFLYLDIFKCIKVLYRERREFFYLHIYIFCCIGVFSTVCPRIFPDFFLFNKF